MQIFILYNLKILNKKNQFIIIYKLLHSLERYINIFLIIYYYLLIKF